MAEALLAIRGLTKRFGGLLASDRIDLDVAAGETHAIIGPNGAGKTTLIGQLAGDLRPDAGIDPVRRSGRHAAGRAASGAAGAGALVPDHEHLPRLLGARQRGARRAGAHRPRASDSGGRRAREPALREPARAALESVGLGARADVRPPISPTASSASSRSRWRWRPSRACSCSTSRWPAWGSRSRSGWSAFLSTLKAPDHDRARRARHGRRLRPRRPDLGAWSTDGSSPPERRRRSAATRKSAEPTSVRTRPDARRRRRSRRRTA